MLLVSPSLVWPSKVAAYLSSPQRYRQLPHSAKSLLIPSIGGKRELSWSIKTMFYVRQSCQRLQRKVYACLLNYFGISWTLGHGHS